eukprot:TRINITY_DN14286_c0_g1_i2.p2 TRINITY_DN14286_c0_g1~~TRINITY_DN14286_c0_g1_i2.p2  ORF type:complete len:112 (-),score=20.58 TRINITY_DN14286_c0_g1_i2:150-485(-)
MLTQFCFFFFQAEDGIRDVERSRGLGDVYKRQVSDYRKEKKIGKTLVIGEERLKDVEDGEDLLEMVIDEKQYDFYILDVQNNTIAIIHHVPQYLLQNTCYCNTQVKHYAHT